MSHQNQRNLSSGSSENNEKGKGKEPSQGGSRKGKGKRGDPATYQMHILTERERRTKMRNMFSNLHSLLPQLSPKADKTAIVDEAISYIKTLEGTLQRLEQLKLERQLQGVGQPKKSSIASNTRLGMLSTRESFMADQVSASLNNNANNNANNSAVANSSTPFSASASDQLPAMIETWTSPNVVLNIMGNDAHFAVYAPKKPGVFANLCAVLEKHKLEVLVANVSADGDRHLYSIQARVMKEAIDEYSGLITVEEIYRQAAGDMIPWVSS